MYKHLFSDMDNTLLRTDGSFSEENSRVIKQTNLPFTLVSARAPMEMDFVLNKLKLSNPQIAFNGALIYRQLGTQREVLYSQPLQPSDFTKLMAVIKAYPEVSLTWYDANNWYAFKQDEGTAYETSITHLEPTLVTEADLKSLTGPFYKFMLICFDLEVLGKLKAALLALGLANVSIVNSNPTYIEITHKDATKANAIAHVQTAEKITKDQLMAFGDGENDLPMLTAVGTAVVVANASAKIKQIADFISKSNDEDGVAYAIKKLILDAEL